MDNDHPEEENGNDGDDDDDCGDHGDGGDGDVGLWYINLSWLSCFEFANANKFTWKFSKALFVKNTKDQENEYSVR